MSANLLQEFAYLQSSEAPKEDARERSDHSSNAEEDDFGDFADPEAGDDDRSQGVRRSSSLSEYGRFTAGGKATTDLPDSLHRDNDAQQICKQVSGNRGAAEVLFDAEATNSLVENIKVSRIATPENSSLSTPAVADSCHPTTHRHVNRPAVPVTSHLEPSARSNLSHYFNFEAQSVKIPPPSALLSSLAPKLQDVYHNIKGIITSDYETLSHVEFGRIRYQLSILTVTGRILSGRSLRWKRDTALSQSMRIGTATRPGGMKLAGLDKTEQRREDQDAIEIVRRWKQLVGPFKALISNLNNNCDGAQRFSMPDLADRMPIRTETFANGAISAPKPCRLCALKRDERVWKVDVDVNDSFGEWWLEHWGHSECAQFWKDHQSEIQYKG